MAAFRWSRSAWGLVSSLRSTFSWISSMRRRLVPTPRSAVTRASSSASKVSASMTFLPRIRSIFWTNPCRVLERPWRSRRRRPYWLLPLPPLPLPPLALPPLPPRLGEDSAAASGGVVWPPFGWRRLDWLRRPRGLFPRNLGLALCLLGRRLRRPFFPPFRNTRPRSPRLASGPASLASSGSSDSSASLGSPRAPSGFGLGTSRRSSPTRGSPSSGSSSPFPKIRRKRPFFGLCSSDKWFLPRRQAWV